MYPRRQEQKVLTQVMAMLRGFSSYKVLCNS